MTAAKIVGPSGRVLAVEPDADNCRLLLLSARLNGLTNVDLFPVALDAHRGFAWFLHHLGSNGGLLEGDSLETGVGTVVPTLTLDELVEGALDVLKLDLEGGEGRAVNGGRDTITKFRPVIITEVSEEMLGRVSHTSVEEYLGWFVDLDYALFVLRRENIAEPEPISLDQLVSDWGDPKQIENLLLLPVERHLS
jgi:FkbM family methyltransferase